MNNKVQLNLMSKTDIRISDKQLQWILDEFQKIATLEEKIRSRQGN